LGVIGEQFSEVLGHGDDVCGITVSVRRNETCLSLWNSKADKFNKSGIEEALKILMPGVVFNDIEYKPHRLKDAFHTAAAEQTA
jgi:hypothetical protein